MIEWSDKYSVGISKSDEEHKKMAKLEKEILK